MDGPERTVSGSRTSPPSVILVVCWEFGLFPLLLSFNEWCLICRVGSVADKFMKLWGLGLNGSSLFSTCWVFLCKSLTQSSTIHPHEHLQPHSLDPLCVCEGQELHTPALICRSPVEKENDWITVGRCDTVFILWGQRMQKRFVSAVSMRLNESHGWSHPTFSYWNIELVRYFLVISVLHW